MVDAARLHAGGTPVAQPPIEVSHESLVASTGVDWQKLWLRTWTSIATELANCSHDSHDTGISVYSKSLESRQFDWLK